MVMDVAVRAVTLKPLIGPGLTPVEIKLDDIKVYRQHYNDLRVTVMVLVLVRLRVPVRYGEDIIAVHLYWPPSLRLSGLKVSHCEKDIPDLPPTLSHR